MKLYLYRKHPYVDSLIKAVNKSGYADQLLQVLNGVDRYGVATYQLLFKVEEGAEEKLEKTLDALLGVSRGYEGEDEDE